MVMARSHVKIILLHSVFHLILYYILKYYFIVFNLFKYGTVSL